MHRVTRRVRSPVTRCITTGSKATEVPINIFRHLQVSAYSPSGPSQYRRPRVIQSSRGSWLDLSVHGDRFDHLLCSCVNVILHDEVEEYREVIFPFQWKEHEMFHVLRTYWRTIKCLKLDLHRKQVFGPVSIQQAHRRAESNRPRDQD